MNKRFRSACLAVLTLVTALCSVLVTATMPGQSAAAVTAHGSVDVIPSLGGGGFDVCVAGTADRTSFIAGQWTLQIAGANAVSLLTHFPPYIWNTATVPQTCVSVAKGSNYGGFTATWNYTAIGTDNTLTLVGTAAWSPATGDRVTGMSG